MNSALGAATSDIAHKRSVVKLRVVATRIITNRIFRLLVTVYFQEFLGRSPDRLNRQPTHLSRGTLRRHNDS